MCYNPAIMIDLHCDTILRLQTEKDSGNLRHNSLSVSLEGLTEINAQAQCFALFTPQEAEDRWAFMRSMHLRFEREVGDNSDLIHKASAPDGSLCAILTIEDMGPTEGLEERVDEVLSWKPRIIGLVWNNENVYARPCSKTAAEMEKGLTEEGRRLAERLAGEHVIVDVSHLSDGGFWDLMEMKDVMIMASHSNCRSLCGHQRNLSDEMIRAIADRGGVVGLNFCPIFLREQPGRTIEETESRIEDMVAHVRHMIDAGGEDVIALGSDNDGIGGQLEIARVSDMPRLLDALSASGLSDRVLEKFWYLNARRVLTEGL